MSIALIGYRGSGKSTVGRLLAQRLGWTFIDTDELIVQQAGQAIRDIFQQHGEPYFRDLESSVVRQVAGRSNAVIALGGGAIIREENRQVLKQASVGIVYLSADADTLAGRIAADPNTAAARPGLTSLGVIDEVRTVLKQRDPIYRSAADLIVGVGPLSPDEIVERVIGHQERMTNDE